MRVILEQLFLLSIVCWLLWMPYFRINSTPASRWREIRCHTVWAMCFPILIPREIVKVFWDCFIIASPTAKICYYMDSLSHSQGWDDFPGTDVCWVNTATFMKSLAPYLPENDSVLSTQDNYKTKPNCNLFWWYHIYHVSPYLVCPDCISNKCSYQVISIQSIYKPLIRKWILSVSFVSMVALTKVWLNS